MVGWDILCFETLGRKRKQPLLRSFLEVLLFGVEQRVDFPRGSVVKNHPAKQEPQEPHVQSLGWEDPLEEGMAAHSGILAWRISNFSMAWGFCLVVSQDS